MPLNNPIGEDTHPDLRTDEQKARHAKFWEGRGPALPQGDPVQAPNVVEAKRRDEAVQHVRAVLNAAATSPHLRTGASLADEDARDFIASHLADVDTAPTRIKEALRKSLGAIVSKVAEGDRLGAEQRAREDALVIGHELGNVPSFSPPEAPDPEALAARIPRG